MPFAHFLGNFDWSKAFLGDETWHSKKYQELIVAVSPLVIAHLPCFKILQKNPILPQKLSI